MAENDRTSDENGMMLSSTGFGLCMGCRQHDRCLLGIISQTPNDEGGADFEVTCPREREGSQGVAHGGWVADVFDEVFGKALLGGGFAVTSSLSVRFLRPVPVGRAVAISVRPVMNDRVLSVTGEMRLGSNGAVLASASGIFVRRNLADHLNRFQAWLTANA